MTAATPRHLSSPNLDQGGRVGERDMGGGRQTARHLLQVALPLACDLEKKAQRALDYFSADNRFIYDGELEI